MKRLLITIIFISMSALLWAQTGTWSGQLEVQGVKLTIVFHLDGENPSMDSPDQGANGIPIQVEKTGTGKVSIKIPVLGAGYEGLFLGGQILGTFSQGGLSLPLTLTPGQVEPNRPQTPVGPFPYTREEVSFHLWLQYHQRGRGFRIHLGSLHPVRG